MPCPLAADTDFFGKAGVKQDQRFGGQTTVFDESETQSLDACAPGQVSGAVATMDDGIGEARAVHVEAQTARFGDGTDGSHFGGGITAAIFGGVGDRDCGGLCPVHIIGDGIEPRGQGIGRQFCTRPVGEQQLAATHVKFGRAGFVILDMRVVMTDDAAIGRAHCRQRKGIGRRAGRDPQRDDIGFEQCRKARIECGA